MDTAQGDSRLCTKLVMLLLVPVKEPNKANIDQIVNSLSDSIAKGDLEVTRVNSLVGKDGIPYLTNEHLSSLQKVSESVGRKLEADMPLYDSGYTAGMVYVKYPSGVRGEIQIVGEKVLDIANAEHIPYDAFLGKPYAGSFPKENLGKASEILDPIRTAATSLDEVQKAKYLGYLNSQYTRARQIEQGASPAAVNLPERISGKLSVDNLIKANGALNQLKATSSSDAIRYERHWVDLAKVPASLTNREARAWYLSKEMDIPNQLDTTRPLEYQAKQSFGIRNDLRSTTRNLMADQDTANYLRRNEPNLSWDELVAIKSMKHSGDDLWNSIINSSQKSRESVNAKFNFVGDRPRYD